SAARRGASASRRAELAFGAGARSRGVAAAALVGGDPVLEHGLDGRERAGEVAPAGLGGGEGQLEARVVDEAGALVVGAEGGEAVGDEVEGALEVAGAGGRAGLGERLDGDPQGRARLHEPEYDGPRARG